MKYDKLVRDKIPEIIKKNDGREPVVHVAGDEEYRRKLKEKLREEVDEFAKDESAGEIADILEVVDAIVEFKKFNKKEIEEIRKRKTEERGAFKKRIILEEA